MLNKIKERLDNNELLFVTEYGSTLYGTTLPTSDTDYKGIFLPHVEGLLLQKSSQTFSFNSNNDNKKNTSDDVDAEVYSLQYFFNLLAKSDTNMVSILFSRKSTDTVVYESPLFKEIFDEVDTSRLISRNLGGMAGYVKSQVYKYSIKGFKYTLLREIMGRLALLQSNRNLEDVFDSKAFVATMEEWYPNKKVRRYLDVVPLPNVDGTVSWYLEILGKKLNFREKVARHMKVLEKLEQGFGHRAKQSSQEDFADRKAVYHAFRVLQEIKELHTTGELVYPISNRDFLLEIRRGEHSMDYLADLLQERLDETNELYETSVLRRKIDAKYMDEIVLRFYERA